MSLPIVLAPPLTAAGAHRVMKDLEAAIASGADLGARTEHIRQLGGSLTQLAAVLHQATEDSWNDDFVAPEMQVLLFRVSDLVAGLGKLAQRFSSPADA